MKIPISQIIAVTHSTDTIGVLKLVSQLRSFTACINSTDTIGVLKQSFES